MEISNAVSININSTVIPNTLIDLVINSTYVILKGHPKAKHQPQRFIVHFRILTNHTSFTVIGKKKSIFRADPVTVVSPHM
jgi:hypothetical protein